MRYAELMDAVKKFKHNSEAPTDPYPMVFDWLSKGDRHARRSVPAVAVFLYTWNNELYTRRKSAVSYWRLARELQQALSDENMNQLLVALENKGIDSDLEVISKQVMDAYRLLSARKLINKTGASKALHLLNPNLFVMWDDRIRSHYHSKHRKHSGHGNGAPECYFAFLKDMQDELRQVLEEKPKAQLLDDLHSIVGYAKTLPKALDEYNFVHKSEWKTVSSQLRNTSA